MKRMKVAGDTYSNVCHQPERSYTDNLTNVRFSSDWFPPDAVMKPMFRSVSRRRLNTSAWCVCSYSDSKDPKARTNEVINRVKVTANGCRSHKSSWQKDNKKEPANAHNKEPHLETQFDPENPGPSKNKQRHRTRVDAKVKKGRRHRTRTGKQKGALRKGI